VQRAAAKIRMTHANIDEMRSGRFRVPQVYIIELGSPRLTPGVGYPAAMRIACRSSREIEQRQIAIICLRARKSKTYYDDRLASVADAKKKTKRIQLIQYNTEKKLRLPQQNNIVIFRPSI